MIAASQDIAPALTATVFVDPDDITLQTAWAGLGAQDKTAWIARMYRFSRLRHFMDKHNQ